MLQCYKYYNATMLIKQKIDGKINLYSCCIDYGFKKFKLLMMKK